jgi:hypothetical protein
MGLEGRGFVEALLAANGGGQAEGSGEAGIEIGKPAGQAPTGVVPGQFLDPRQRRPAPPSAITEARGDGEDRRQRKGKREAEDLFNAPPARPVNREQDAIGRGGPKEIRAMVR